MAGRTGGRWFATVALQVTAKQADTGLTTSILAVARPSACRGMEHLRTKAFSRADFRASRVRYSTRQAATGGKCLNTTAYHLVKGFRDP
jgi:hypothetical protein